MSHEIQIGQRYPDELIIKVLKDYVSGMSVTQLTKKYQIYNTTIDSWARKSGVYQPKRFRHDWSNIQNQIK